ncbi:MAG: hypothetical protein OEZ06_26780 [Myxococcales bacterium]|nr:hypothetical protein [Myxococcales bacterium]
MGTVTGPDATVIGAAIAALFGLVSGGVSSWLVYWAQTRKRSDELFGAALGFLDHGSQRRNVGIARLRLYMREYPSYDKDVCAEVLVGTAIYLLLESEQKGKAHELLNLDRIMKILLSELEPSDVTRASYESLGNALKSRLEMKDRKPEEGLWLDDGKLEGWKVSVEKLMKRGA